MSPSITQLRDTKPLPRSDSNPSPKGSSRRCGPGDAPSPGWGSSRRSIEVPPRLYCGATGRKDRCPRSPLVDVCNAISLAFATPIAVFDLSKVVARLEVRYATGEESYLTFSGGETERPVVGEVIFADALARVHARRWTNRQSAYSAVNDATGAVLIVAEAMHASGRRDMPRLTEAVAAELQACWSVTARVQVLSASHPRFDL